MLHQEKITELYLKGYLVKDIAKELNLNSSTISNKLKTLNLQREEPLIKSKIWEKSEEIISLYNQGIGSHRISKQLGISKTTVLDYLRKLDINRRENNGNLQRKYDLDFSYFTEINTEEKAYILGILCADGSTYKDEYKVSIGLVEKDLPVLEFIKEQLGYTGPLYYNNRNSKNEKWQNTYTLSISSKQIWEDCQKWGLLINKTFKTTFPLTIPKGFYKDFIRGYFDGDGYVSKKGYRIELVGTEELLIEIANQIHFNTGYTWSYNRKRHPERNNNIITLVYAGKNKCKAIAEYLYPVDTLFGMKRKKDKLLSFKEKI